MFFQFSMPVGFLHTEFCIMEERYRFRFTGSNQVHITLEKLDPTIIFSPSCTNQSEFPCWIAQWYFNTVAGSRQIMKNKNNLFIFLITFMWNVESEESDKLSPLQVLGPKNNQTISSCLNFLMKIVSWTSYMIILNYVPNYILLRIILWWIQGWNTQYPAGSCLKPSKLTSHLSWTRSYVFPLYYTWSMDVILYFCWDSAKIWSFSIASLDGWRDSKRGKAMWPWGTSEPLEYKTLVYFKGVTILYL